MQRVNADFSCRVASILSDAINSMKGSNDAMTEVLAQDLLLLKKMSCHFISLSSKEFESARLDKIEYECEEQQKNKELTRLEAKLASMREERDERRQELEDCLNSLREKFTSKEEARSSNQKQREQVEMTELSTQQSLFLHEYEALEKQKTQAISKCDEHKSIHTVKEAELHAKITDLQSSLQRLAADHEMQLLAKQMDVDSVRTILEQQNVRRMNLIEHFKRVDHVYAQREEEEAKLRMVSDDCKFQALFHSTHPLVMIQPIAFFCLMCQVHELEEKANALLDNGATALQKLWRGMKGRALAKAKRSKKKGSKKKKKKK